MQQDILLKQKIGLRLTRVGLMSKVFAIQTFTKGKCEITPEQFSVLFALKENDGMYLRQLATITYKDRPNMTRIVTILENNGFLTSALEADGRQVKKLYITDKGKKICNKMLPTIMKVWSYITTGIDEEEIDNFLLTLDKIEENLKKEVVLQN